MKTKLTYLLLLIPVVMAILALSGFGFFFKSGSAGAGILIILFAYFGRWSKFKDIWMIVGAFLFSIGGDWFLSNRNGDTNMFIAGIALFFIAHIGYFTYALMNGKMNWISLGMLLAGYLVFFFLKLVPALDNKILLIAVLAYLFISCFSLAAAIGIKANSIVYSGYVFGIALVLFSDTIIAFREFVGYHQLDFLILPTYYMAHISITFSLLKRSEMK